MRSRLLWRRSATAAGLYSAVALGIAGTVVASRVLGLERFGLYATALAVASFLQTLLDLTVEESLTKYGFRYVAAEDWGRLHRLFARALQLKLAGGALAGAALLALAPLADVVFGAEGLTAAVLVSAGLPLVQAPENVAATALLLRGRYDLRGAYMAFAMGLRLAAIAIGTQFGIWQTVALIVAAQAISTGAVGAVGLAAYRRFPAAPQRPLGDDRREIVSFVAQSSLATGMLSLRTTLAPLLLGVVAGPTQVGLLRIAQAPQSGLTAASSPVRLVLLTEQTRDWERGQERDVVAGVRRYMLAAGALMTVAVPVFMLAMPWLVRVVFGSDYANAVTAARVILVAAAVQLVLGWTKSLPVTIGRPRLRILTHGIETAVLLPLVVAFGAIWGVSGAAIAMLVATIVFAAVWAVVLARLATEVEERHAAAASGSAPAA
ncbi:Polysaccharide biosynthesis protein [Gaiella occulta]|uniref:Polysaccharide biosynthesis protein n=1 Tax=Gaiella occulta TaxID=1002870 RepID=A0A7M2YWL7_9ACTN|nr:lipopolysaccharide biosynthesis protein [Gaiella occulta]RDI74284.1 Polysaccharide biosynthesis protein [Gaiella occulta]